MSVGRTLGPIMRYSHAGVNRAQLCESSTVGSGRKVHGTYAVPIQTADLKASFGRTHRQCSKLPWSGIHLALLTLRGGDFIRPPSGGLRFQQGRHGSGKELPPLAILPPSANSGLVACAWSLRRELNAEAASGGGAVQSSRAAERCWRSRRAPPISVGETNSTNAVLRWRRSVSRRNS
ncbi:hypothetical protein Q31a_25910 [Aureliella helgolandensis]|uniref:Uncharacterized protein n=1 Tax=Aureliella helgolandensis TaxID=2527968 RepID=A0A518G6S1_9BACT|nr:hypothetical protein Q31a_25910 [Aureliella helgolandensis]